MSLNSTPTEFWITIRKDKKIQKNKLIEFIEKQSPKTYAYAEHDGDISVDTGEVEGTHYHLYLAIQKKCRISTMYNRINEHFGFANSNGINVQKAECFEGCIQYLVHKNEPKKTQHKIEEIVSNLPIDELSIIINKESDTLTFQKVYNICISAKTILDVIQAVGWHRYCIYRNAILDVFKATAQYRPKCDI